MKNLVIKEKTGQEFTPEVNFNFQQGTCEISGESYMERTNVFYQPLLDWLNKYLKHKKELVFNIKLNYFNTSSSRYLLEMLKLLNKSKKKGATVEVKWYYKEMDIDLEEEIEDLEISSGLDIKRVSMN